MHNAYLMLIMCVHVYPCEDMYPWRPEEGAPGAGVTRSCELSDVGAGN